MAYQQLIDIESLGSILGGRSRASLYRDMKRQPGFPQPLKIGRATRFRLSDVERYIASLGEGSQIDHEAA